MKTLRMLVMAVAALAALSGCTVPRFLVADSFVGGRNDKTILIPRSAADKVQLYDYVVRLCDLDAQGVESNCKDSVVLSSVVSNSVY